MDTAKFERDRLDLFRRNGFDGESRFFDDGRGGRTYAIVGKGSGRPTLVIHGGLAEASVWASMAPHLGATVVIPDRPGHGLTSGVDYRGVDYRRAAADWMLHVVDGLGAHDVDLVGNSMGGYFCLAFALAHPERVRKLALVGAPAGIDRELPLFLRLWGRPVTGAAIAKMIAAMHDPEVMRARIFGPLCAHPERIAPDALRVSLDAGARPDWHVTMRSMLNAVTDFGGWRAALSLREDAARLAVPTLFAWGDKDSFAPPASGEKLAARMPNARVTIIEDAGHLPQLDQPERVAAAVNAFFAEHDASAAAAE